MRVASIDLGSNSFHMLIAEILGPTSFKTVTREKMMIQIGKTSLVTDRLDSEAMRRGLECLDKFRQIAMARRAERILAVATSAIREAENGEEFIRRAGTESGIVVRVISSREEARLVHLAVSQQIDMGDRKALIVDIGGGSVEFIVGDARKMYSAESHKLGFLRLHGRFITHDPMSKHEEQLMKEFLRNSLSIPLLEISRQKPRSVIATSGSATTLLRIAQQRRGETNGAALRSSNVNHSEISAILREMRQMNSVERTKKFDLDPLRSEYLPVALFCLDAVLKGVGAKEVTICQVALREGLIYDMLANAKPRKLIETAPPDMRRQAVIDLAARCDYPPEHSHKVSLLAGQIFKQTAHLHELGETEGRLLEYAGILHDIGYHIGYAKHHKHGYYLIMNGDLRGFTPEERIILAMLVRYHRRATPKDSHPEFASLPKKSRRVIQCLSSILRIADGLDQSHFSYVNEVKCRSSLKMTRFALITDAQRPSIELDLWTAKRHARYFEKLFGIETVFALGKPAAQGKLRAKLQGEGVSPSPNDARKAYKSQRNQK
jgi:exopolyphosphatase / guanosine-5'-triphosphate,3'-diphosphate pyrophosphatase